MKKLILFAAFSVFVTNVLFAQVVPEGMNYQAVARNLQGEILANQPVALKVSLISSGNNDRVVYYKEVHEVITSAAGVFSLVIGKGKSEMGDFSTIPWDKENVWMEVSIRGKGQSDFTNISNSKLLAVPYAFHSLSADKLTGELFRGNEPGVPSQNWSLFGNSNSNANIDKLGTTDSIDLVMVTNNKERLRILANGNIAIKRSLSIGADLSVDSSVYLNKVSGSTINYGPFTVERQSPTLLSGTLTVDKETDLNSSLNVDGITDLNSKLNVNNNSPSVLTGTLRVDGVTDLNNDLNVNNIGSTVLSGTLRVDKDATLNEKLKVLSTYQTDTSGVTPSGSLQVGGGAYVGKNLYIGGIAKFGGPAAFGGKVTITDPSESTSPITGALMIPFGGLGVGKRLNVGGGVLLGSTLGVTGLTTLDDATQSTLTTNGALILKGGAGIAKNVNIGGSLTTAGISTLNNTLNVNASTPYVANFVNTTSSGNGISIKINATTPANANNFVTFRNSAGATVGRIEGETLSELVNNDDYKVEKKGLDLAVTMATIDVVTGGIDIAMAGVDLVGAASSSTVCAGLGVCVTAPVPSLIIAAGIKLAAAIANEISVAIGLSDAITQRNYFVNTSAANIGVTYQSGSGDYAEWLPKANNAERFKPGFIVGMKNGQISLNTAGTDKLFAISTKPIVLGNMPAEGKEDNYEKVAFMGQIPVHVVGKVNAGDYILPSGFNNGFGKAISPQNMKVTDYAKIVGMAWSTSLNEGYNLVNVAIGLNAGDISKVVAEQGKEISELKTALNEVKSLIAKITSGSLPVAVTESPTKVATVNSNTTGHVDFLQQTESDIVYFKITTAQTTEMLSGAQRLMVERGVDVSTHPFWSRINSDPGYKNTVMEQMKSAFEKGMHTHKEINSKASLQPAKQ